MSINELLEEIARRGSWYGGGSVAALGAAVSAALLEKLVGEKVAGRRLRRIRRYATRVIEEDAKAFARVIAATRSPNRRRFRSALNAATCAQETVLRAAGEVQRAGRAARRAIKPRFQSDLRCAMALANASAESAKGFIKTNLTWLNDSRGTRPAQRRPRRPS